MSRTSNKKLAEALIGHHKGIPNVNVARELCDSFFIVLRKVIIKDGEINLDGIGKLTVKRYKGTENKKDPRTGIVYKIPPRNVVKFKVHSSLNTVLNMNRPAREKVG